MKKILVIIFLTSFLFINFVFAQGYKISVSLPGAPKGTEVRDPSEYIGILFKAGLAIAGVLALVFLLYGAILYTISSSRGNVEGESQAKERIYSVFLGLGLLLLSYLILYTINPDLVKLKMPRMKVSPDVQTSQPQPSQPSPSQPQPSQPQPPLTPAPPSGSDCVTQALNTTCKDVCPQNTAQFHSMPFDKLEECMKCIREVCSNQ
ncbi:hypothetical protein J7K91_01660 [bacterium]|nr:hypothetical protein [bacterium]